MFLNRILVLAAAVSLTFGGSARAAQGSASESSAWDRLYGGYDTAFKSWKDLPGIEIFSYSNGDPVVSLKPALDSIEHRGTLGVRLPETWGLFGGSDPRLEGGGSSDHGTFKTQYDTPVIFDGPFTNPPKDAGTSSFNLSGLGLYFWNSYTYDQSERVYFIDYRADYRLTPAIRMTPKIGYVHSDLHQSHLNFLSAPQFNSYLTYTEMVHRTSHGARTGLDLEAPIGGGFDFLFGVQYTLSYDETDLRVDSFDSSDASTVVVEDGRNVLARKTDLTLGVRKDFWGAVVSVNAGISFYSDMPRVVNPIRASDQDAHLENVAAYSEYVQVSVAYAI